MLKHPKDRQSRRSVTAKALEQKQFRQRVVNGKKRKLHVIEDQETQDELRSANEVAGLSGPDPTVD